MNTGFHTTHNLAFEVAPWDNPLLWDNEGFMRFRTGTVTGLWRHTKDGYEVLAIVNDLPGNGHLQDFLEWFYHSCKREKCSFIIREFFNLKFKDHLINKHGFRPYGKNDLIKPLHKIKPPANSVTDVNSGTK